MLVKPENPARDCLRRLNSPEFAPLLQFLQAEVSASMHGLMLQRDEAVLRNLQGRAQALHEILSLVAELAKH